MSLFADCRCLGPERCLLASLLGTALALAALVGCAGDASRTDATATSGVSAPDWVSSGGNSPRYPRSRYVTGFAMVATDPAQGCIESAKQQAAASLSRSVSVRIQASLLDVTESRDGADSYELASIVNSTSDIQLSGLHYEVHPEAGQCQAFAVLDRERARLARRELLARSQVEVRECLASGARHEAAGREADAIATYESCRGPIAEALEHDSIARALGDVAEIEVSGAAVTTEGPAWAELVAANRTVDEKVRAILRRPATSLSEAVERLGIQLRRQNALGAGQVVVSPFTYGTTDLSSVFGRQAGVELEGVLARASGPPGESMGDRVVRGVYFERDEEVRISATVRDTASGRLVASAESTLPRAALPAGVSLKPANFEAALRDQRVLGQGELVSGDLQVEVWTDRGRRGVVYSEREQLTIHYRVNQPAWIRLLYVLQSGEQVPIASAWYVDASKVNQVLTYPDRFEIVPPFGVEHVHATAFASKPEELVTVRRVIDGEEYEVVSDGLAQIIRTRGIKRVQREEMAESLVTVTTMPR